MVLRRGYSTGACAAAVAKAAWLFLQHGTRAESVSLRFPDGEERILLLLPPEKNQMAAIRKDAGDDPDCTNGLVLYARISRFAGSPQAEDYILHAERAIIVLRAVEGIGICTRAGLDCDQGHWAINIIPRQMIASNLAASGMQEGRWLLEIGAVNGAHLAKKTLNAHLGIYGGLSILGTTGIVQPYSHDAWIQTIHICVRAHALAGGSSAVFCTGGRTHACAKQYLKNLPETAFVHIGDFIAESLRCAYLYNMQAIYIACMPGKLCKYADGCTNTHASFAEQKLLSLRRICSTLPADQRISDAVLDTKHSAREMLLLFSKIIQMQILHDLAAVALGELQQYCPARQLCILVADFSGRILFAQRQ